MEQINYGGKLQDLDALVSKWYNFSRIEEETKTSIDKIRRDAENGEQLLTYFKGIDSDLASMVESCNDYASLKQISLEAIFDKLSEIEPRIEELDALVKEVSNFSLTIDVHNKEQICTRARALVLFCKNNLKCQHLDDKVREISNSKKELDDLLSYLKSDKAQLDSKISEIEKQVTRLSEYADRFGCRMTLGNIRCVLKTLPSGNVQADLSLLSEQSRKLNALEKQFDDEQKEAISVYNDVCSESLSIWRNLLNKFKEDMAYVCDGRTATQPDFDLESFKETVDNLRKKKKKDIELYANANHSLAKRYSDSLQKEIIDKVCSYDDFIAWQEKIKKLEHERIKEAWMKALKIIGSILKYIFLTIVAIGGLVFSILGAFFNSKSTDTK